ncbi:MAG: hypothetical protein ACXWPG_08565, partial [Ktedonobacteraceae bacterium]
LSDKLLVGVHPQPSAPIGLSHLRRSGAPNPVCLFNRWPQRPRLDRHRGVPIHSRETVTRTSLVGWSRPGLRSSQAHRMKAIGYVTNSGICIVLE